MFDRLEISSFNEILSLEEKKVTYIESSDRQGFFLKCSEKEPPGRYLRTIFSGRFPHSAAVRELCMLQKLQTAGFETMESVAWGEQRKFGIPVRGFLLVQEVKGEEFSDLFSQADGRKKKVLMREAGALIAKLHTAGFFQPVRLKDLIRTEQGLVLIDRETSKPWRRMFFLRRAIASLARATRRTLRDGHQIRSGSASAFLKGYLKGLSDRREISATDFRRRLFRSLRRELGSA